MRAGSIPDNLTEERRYFMKKRLISLALAVALLAAMVVPASAATYSDLKGHWAETYIQKLSNLGYLNGYTDGTVRPNGTITTCEALVLVSRFYSVDSTTLGWIEDDYGAFVQKNIDTSLSWAYDGIEICLASGILTESELLNLRLTTPIEKELLSVLLVRALKMTDEASAKAGTALSFSDAANITSAYIGYVAALKDAKIIEGDNQNRFQPHSSVTRAVVAAMVVRGLDYVSTSGKTLKLTGYENYAKVSGLLTAASASSVTIRDTDGVSRVYAIPAGLTVTVGSSSQALSSSLVGLYATIAVNNSVVKSITAANEEGVTWAQGLVTSISNQTSSTGATLYIKNLDTDTASHYTALTTAAVTVSCASSTIDKIVQNQFVTLKLKSGKISEITAVPGSYTLTAKISALTYGEIVTLTLSADAGSSLVYLLDIGNLPTIMRGDNQVGIERLSVGDTLTVTVTNGAVTKLATAASSSTLDGVVTSIVSTANGTSWVITDTAGSTHTLSIDSSASIYQGSKALLLTDVQAGDTVSVVADNNVISEVYLKSSNSNTASKLTASVLAVDTAKRRVTALSTSSGKLVYITLASSGTVFNTATGKDLTVSSLAANQQVIAYGAYSDSANFAATSIIIEP